MNNTIKRTWNQGSMVNIEDLRGMTFQEESGGHTFVISAVDADGNAVTMSGTPSGTMLRPDNTDQALTCSISGGKVYATLPAGCYAVPGRAGITIFLTSDSQKTAIYAAIVSVTRTQSGTASPGTTQTVVDLINAINAAIAGIPATDTALKAAMAPTYSTSGLYAVGQYAWYNGTLYKCTTAITTAETWTSGHWTAAALGNDVCDLKSALNDYTFANNHYIDLLNRNMDDLTFTKNYTPLFKNGQYNGTTILASNVNIYAILPAGAYEFKILSGDGQFSVWNYVPNGTGTIVYSFTSDPKGRTFDNPIIVMLRKGNGSDVIDETVYASLISKFSISYHIKKIYLSSSSQYISTSGDIANLTPISASGYHSAVVDCTEGVCFTVTSTSGGSASLPYAFIDSSNKFLEKSDSSSLTGRMIVAPKNTAKVIFNTANESSCVINYGWYPLASGLEKIASYIVNINENTDNIQKLQEISHINNDLQTDGVKSLGDCIITLDNVASPDNYGKSGAVYKLKVPDYRKLHLYFEYKWDEALPFNSVNEQKLLARIFGDYTKAIYFPRQSFCSHGDFIRLTWYGVTSLGRSATTRELVHSRYKTLVGNTAFIIKYTGTVASSSDYVDIAFDDTSITFTKNGTNIGSVSFNGTDSVQSLVDSINALTDFECKAVCVTNHTCSELLPVVITPNLASYSLGDTYTDTESNTKYQNNHVIVPYALNEEWHSVECIVDPDSNKAYISFDGVFIERDLDSSGKTSGNKFIEIGMEEMTVKNLVLDYGDYGDAEIVTSTTYPYNSMKQLISEHNPRVIVFEGHDVTNTTEDDYDTSTEDPEEQMAASTDRLNYLFDYLSEKGYVPITWQKLKEWKLSNEIIKMPKRCYVPMFDDYRYNIYMDYECRKPFVKHNVQPGLAVISSRKSKDETVTIDGIQFTYGEIWNSIVRSGWYPCSHTSSHRHLNNYSMSELDDILKTDILDCDAHNIYSDIIVYPYGDVTDSVIAAVAESDFVIGVNITSQHYNCRGISNYDLTRVEIGQRVSIENVKLAIV